MLSNEMIQEIQQLLAKGLSQRIVARLVGVSNTFVSRVQNAKRKIYVDPNEHSVGEAQGERVRCPTCGGKTRLPCPYCRVRELLARHPYRRRPDPVATKPVEFSIELTGRLRQRYEKIRDWRAAQKNPYFIDIPEDWPWRKKSDTKNTLTPTKNHES